MADEEQEQPTAAKRRRKASQPAEPAKEHPGPPKLGPPAEASADQGRGDAGESAQGATGRVTGSVAPASPGDLSGRALRELLAELPPEARNPFIPGTLTVHYVTRDVDFPMDGESAMRMLAVLAATSNDVDDIDRTSDAQRTWLMIDRKDVIGAQWTPGYATVPRRATLDPGGLVDAST
jgi:hypothetical protein